MQPICAYLYVLAYCIGRSLFRATLLRRAPLVCHFEARCARLCTRSASSQPIGSRHAPTRRSASSDLVDFACSFRAPQRRAQCGSGQRCDPSTELSWRPSRSLADRVRSPLRGRRSAWSTASASSRRRARRCGGTLATGICWRWRGRIRGSRWSCGDGQAGIRSSKPATVRHRIAAGHLLRPSAATGRDKVVCVRKLDTNQLRAKIGLLLDASGLKIRPLARAVESTNESVRGIWSALHDSPSRGLGGLPRQTGKA